MPAKISLLSAGLVILGSCGPAAPNTEASKTAPAAELIEIKPSYPRPMFIDAFIPPDAVPNLEEPSRDPRSFMAPKGTENMALNKRVTSSDTHIAIPGPDSLKLLTDGDADLEDGNFVVLAPGPQWVQIDLEKDCDISKIIVWHFHRQALIVKDVVVQIADDSEFKTGVTTVYNADIDNACKQGKGNDKAWIQTNHGRMIDGKNTQGRYVRLWSSGSTMDDFNRYVEVSVYGTPAR